MRILLSSLLVLVFGCSYALAKSPSLVNYLRTEPAEVSGMLQLESAHHFTRDQGLRIPFTDKRVHFNTSGIRPNKTVNFGFDERQIHINSKNAIYVSVGGVPINIKRITYDHKTGQVSVSAGVLTKIAREKFEGKVQAELEKHFKPKLQVAFQNLSKLRSQRTIGDASQVLKEVMGAFSGDEKGKPFPGIRGDITLINHVNRGATVDINGNAADLKSGDFLNTTLTFRKPSGSPLRIHELSFMSAKGITIRSPETKKDSIKTMELNSFSLSEAGGLQVTATNGGDDTYNGVVLVTELLKVAQTQSTKSLEECQKAEVIQSQINSQARSEMVSFIKEYRTDLLKAGATPQLLLAVENVRKDI